MVMSNQDQSDVDKQREQVATNAKAISDAAKIIYDLIPPGANVRIEWITQPMLLARGVKPQKHVLNIAKPMIDLVMTMKVK